MGERNNCFPWDGSFKFPKMKLAHSSHLKLNNYPDSWPLILIWMNHEFAASLHMLGVKLLRDRDGVTANWALHINAAINALLESLSFFMVVGKHFENIKHEKFSMIWWGNRNTEGDSMVIKSYYAENMNERKLVTATRMSK